MKTSERAPAGGPPPFESGWGGDGNRHGESRRIAMTAMYVVFVYLVMTFATFTSAMVVRRGLGSDWTTTPLPAVLWVNTVVLIASSAVFEKARRLLRARQRSGFEKWWLAGVGLSVLFLAGQVLAWWQLRSAGVYLSGNPSGAFFYVITVSHAVHLLGGFAALVYLSWKAHRGELGPAKRTAVDASTLYWHFLGGIWVYVIVLFAIWG